MKFKNIKANVTEDVTSAFLIQQYKKYADTYKEVKEKKKEDNKPTKK